jgi:hypothetical protein
MNGKPRWWVPGVGGALRHSVVHYPHIVARNGALADFEYMVPIDAGHPLNPPFSCGRLARYGLPAGVNAIS